MRKAAKVLLLKVVPATMQTRNGFTWPTKGTIEAPDWDGKPECGGGLHAWLWTPSCNLDRNSNYHKEECKWLVIQADPADIVDLKDKVKFRKGTVVFCGTFLEAVARIQKDPTQAGFLGSATAGYGGSATAGYGGSATAGYGGCISIEWWDEANQRYRRAVAEVGFTPGVEAGKRYRVEAGLFVQILETEVAPSV